MSNPDADYLDGDDMAMAHMAQQIADLERQLAEAREALAPFAAAADWNWEDTVFKRPEATVLINPDGRAVRRSDFDKAKKALAGKENT